VHGVAFEVCFVQLGVQEVLRPQILADFNGWRTRRLGAEATHCVLDGAGDQLFALQTRRQLEALAVQLLARATSQRRAWFAYVGLLVCL